MKLKVKATYAYKPTMLFTGKLCTCKPGIERANCPMCEGTGAQLDFRAIRAKGRKQNA